MKFHAYSPRNFLVLYHSSSSSCTNGAGSVELAAVGVSIAVFNQVSRIAIFPLVSVTTSFVAEEDTIRQSGPISQDTESLDVESMSAGSESKKLIPENGMPNNRPC